MNKKTIITNWTGILISIIVPVMLTLGYISCSAKEDPLPDNGTEEKPAEEIKPFGNVPTLSDMVIYEVNPLAFGPKGTFANIEARLEHIKGLGVNVVWLMPIHPKGIEKGVGSPYAVMDYKDVNPDYGTLSDFKQLVKAAHQLDMAVIIDWVANHTSWDNEWINNEGWYMTDASGNIINPPGTNWNDVAELNFNNMEMRAEMIGALNFWIDQCNIDGFRFDAVDFVPDAFWHQALDSLKKFNDRNLILLAEGGKPALLNAGFQMIYGWDFQSKLRNIFHSNHPASDIHQTHQNEYRQMGEGKQRLRYITNHDLCAWDESPVKAFVNTRGSVAAFAITTFMGGVPLIYNGQEIAWPNQISFFNLNPLNWTINPDIYNEYADIIHTRQQHSKTVAGTTNAYPNADVVAFTKTGNNTQLLVIVNTRQKAVAYEIPSALTGKKLTRLIGPETSIENTSINLEAFDYYVFKIE